ncbi:MAG: DUF1127 domain-containing protein [Paracoccaceae bacterium]|jgi:uncharacterized protein YjiS (DUF1127 family)
MAFVSSEQPSIISIAAYRTARLFDGIAEKAQRRAAYKKTVNELSALTDRELNDLGIARTEIAAIAAKAVL